MAALARAAAAKTMAEANLFLDVVERVGRVDGEADEDDVRVGVRQRTKTVVVFLTRGIPQS